jgi:protein-S-isoprenylcysteine O-methyltransferase Ste14
VLVAIASEPRDLPRYSVPPPLPPAVALVLIVVLALVAPVDFLPTAVSLIVGIPLLVLGLGLWLWGMRSLFQLGESPDGLRNHAHGNACRQHHSVSR